MKQVIKIIGYIITIILVINLVCADVIVQTSDIEAKGSDKVEISKSIYEYESYAGDHIAMTEEDVSESKSEIQSESIEKDAEKNENYLEVKEVVYATNDVYIRSEAEKSAKVIGILLQSSNIERIGKGDNGWSKVIYNNGIAYICSKYLTTTKPVLNTVKQEMNKRNGMIGRFSIPEIDIDVAVFSSNNDNAQSITDAKDSAAYIDFGLQDLIADHNYQGFSKMKNAVPGKTLAYFNNGDAIKTYICVAKGNGQNIKSDLLDENGKSVADQNTGGLCLYTCNSNARDIYYTFWKIWDK